MYISKNKAAGTAAAEAAMVKEFPPVDVGIVAAAGMLRVGKSIGIC